MEQAMFKYEWQVRRREERAAGFSRQPSDDGFVPVSDSRGLWTPVAAYAVSDVKGGVTHHVVERRLLQRAVTS